MMFVSSCNFCLHVSTQQASLKQLTKNKVPHLCVMIKSITINTDASVVLRDPTGEIQGTIHRRLIEEHQAELKPGCVLVLRQVSYSLVWNSSICHHFFFWVYFFCFITFYWRQVYFEIGKTWSNISRFLLKVSPFDVRLNFCYETELSSVILLGWSFKSISSEPLSEHHSKQSDTGLPQWVNPLPVYSTNHT